MVGSFLIASASAAAVLEIVLRQITGLLHSPSFCVISLLGANVTPQPCSGINPSAGIILLHNSYRSSVVFLRILDSMPSV